MSDDKAIVFYDRKIPGQEQYESIHVGLTLPVGSKVTDDQIEDAFRLVIEKVGEKIELLAQEEEIMAGNQGRSLAGKKLTDVYTRDFIKVEDLEGKAWLLEVRDVQGIQFPKFRQPTQKEERVCLFFNPTEQSNLIAAMGQDRYLILNVGTAKKIAGFFGEEFTNWIGQRIVLFPKQDGNKIRVDVALPKNSGQKAAPKTDNGQAAKNNGLSDRPWSPEVLRQKLQAAAAAKKNEKTDIDIASKLAQLIGAKGPALFQSPPTEDATTVEDAFADQEAAKELYHKLLDYCFFAVKDGEVSAMNLRHYEGLAFAGWLLGKPIHKIATKEWFKTPVDDLAHQEAEKWLVENAPVDEVDDQADNEAPKEEAESDWEIPF